jgi:uncharacterized membrane protein YphA (DoxX/SURF4 family)
MKPTGAVSIAPFILRITIGIIFIWAGLVKVMSTFEVKGADAARLANMGVFIDTTKPKAPSTPTAPSTTTPAEPAKPQSSRAGGFVLVSSPAPGQQYTAENFPDPVPVMRIYQLALMLDTLANATDPVDANAKPTFRLWPKALGQGIWPLAGAWACTIAEIGCGVFLIVGLIVRLCSFVLVFNMLVAMWLTVIGPAVQSGNTQLGILPKTDLLEGDWSMFQTQLLCLGGAAALLFSGAGGLSIDRALFGGPTGSRPAPKKAAAEE